MVWVYLFEIKQQRCENNAVVWTVLTGKKRMGSICIITVKLLLWAFDD